MSELDTLYKRLMRQVHPDGGPPEQRPLRTIIAQQINEAKRTSNLSLLRRLSAEANGAFGETVSSEASPQELTRLKQRHDQEMSQFKQKCIQQVETLNKTINKLTTEIALEEIRHEQEIKEWKDLWERGREAIRQEILQELTRDKTFRPEDV